MKFIPTFGSITIFLTDFNILSYRYSFRYDILMCNMTEKNCYRKDLNEPLNMTIGKVCLQSQ